MANLLTKDDLQQTLEINCPVNLRCHIQNNRNSCRGKPRLKGLLCKILETDYFIS